MSHRRRFPNQPARRASNLSRSLFGNRSRQRLHRSDRRSLHFETFESRCVLASVSGGVYLDANNDGLQGTGELGIPGVQIALLGADTSGNNVNLTTLSKNDGTFVFSNLAAGTYQLREAQANSFTDGKDTTTASGATAGQDEITNLVLTAEQSLSGNLFGQRALKPEYLSIAWFFASTPADTTPLIREVVAIGEERAGHTELAESIRNDQDSTDPDNPNTNRPPVATNDSYSTVQGQLLEITVATGVLANDTDADANPLTATLVQGPSNGTVVLRLDGSFTYTPNGTFSGTDTFTYQARDTTSVSNTATVSISVALRPNRFIIPENSDRGTTVGSVEPPAGVSGTLSFTIQDPALPADLVVRPDDHVIGEFASPMTLIQYIDLQEPADAEIYPLVRQLESEFGGELLVVRRHRPEVRVNPNSQLAAIAAEAAARQDAFDDMIDLLYDRQSEWSVAGDVNSLFLNYATELDLDVDQFEMDLSSSVVAARVQRDIDAADRLGVELTPAFYLNGQLLDNEDVFDDFAEIIERELADFDSAFTIDRSTGELYVNTGSRLDYESQPLWSLTVLATNPSGVSTPIAVTVTLTDINESTPIANNDTYSGFANTPFTATAAIGVLANDIDEDNLMITAQAVTPPAHGTLNLNTDGSFAYVPDADFTGMDSFTYIASDGTKNSAPATVTINVQAVNTDGVVAQNDLYTALRNTELQIGTALGVLANDTHAVGTTLTAQLVSTPEHGTVAFGSDGSFFYNPAVNFTGTDTFSYRATDGVHQSEVTTVTINVVINNRPPVALNDNYAVDKNLILTIPASSGVLVNDTDPDNDNLTTQLVSTTTFGSLVLNANGSFTYVPLQDYAGTDSFTYRAVDGLTTSGIATVTLTVNATNAPPIAVNDAYELDPNSHFEITLNNGLLLNDFDEDDDPIQAELVSNVSHGQLELRADGTFTYVSTADFTGTDTFTYRISDGSTNSAAATVTLNIREENVFSVLEGTEAGAKFGQVSTLGQAFVGPRVYQWHGHETQFPAELYLFPNDHLSGNPRAGVTLIAYMDFQSSTDRSYHQSLRSLEANQNSDLLVVRRHLPATSSGTSSLQAAQAAEAAGRQGKFDEMADLLFENQAIWSAEANPQLMFETYATTLGLNLTQFNADFVSTQVFSRINRDLTAAAQLEIADTPGIFLDGQLIENLPSDPSGLAERIELAVASNDTPIAIDRTTGELFVRRPAAFDFLDNQRFVFDVLTRDGGGHAAHNTLTIFVLPGGTDIPVAIDDAYTVNANGVLQVEAANGVLANDVGDNGQALTANLVGNATHGTVSLQLDGSFTYQPTTDFTGTDQFTYLVIAGSFVSPLANVVITVNPEGPQNLLPIAVNDSYRVQVNGTLSVAAVDGVLKNDSDPDSNSLAASLIDYPTHGTAVLATNGAFQYTPLLDFVGTDEFRYVVSDGQASSQAQVVIEVFEATAPEQNGGEAEGEGESSPITDLIDTLFEDDLTDWLEPSLIR